MSPPRTPSLALSWFPVSSGCDTASAPPTHLSGQATCRGDGLAAPVEETVSITADRTEATKSIRRRARGAGRRSGHSLERSVATVACGRASGLRRKSPGTATPLLRHLPSHFPFRSSHFPPLTLPSRCIFLRSGKRRHNTRCLPSGHAIIPSVLSTYFQAPLQNAEGQRCVYPKSTLIKPSQPHRDQTLIPLLTSLQDIPPSASAPPPTVPTTTQTPLSPPASHPPTTPLRAQEPPTSPALPSPPRIHTSGDPTRNGSKSLIMKRSWLWRRRRRRRHDHRPRHVCCQASEFLRTL